MKDVAGKVAFVTGGASGIGLAIVRAFTGAGMKVVIADIEQQAITTALQEFEASNADVIGVKVDVNDREEMEAAAKTTEEKFGKVHVLCNNAGIVLHGSIETMSYKDWDWAMNVNVQGVINGVQTFLPRLLAHGEGGHVVNTASMAGQFPVRGLGVYTTSKFAVVGLSEALRLDLTGKGVGVSVLCPGVVKTNIGDSLRNRPNELLKTEADPDIKSSYKNLPPSEIERQTRVAELAETQLDASVVGIWCCRQY